MKATTIILTGLITVLALPLQSQNKKSPEQILKETTDKTKSYNTIKIEFTYNMDNPEAKIHESQKGTLQIKGDQYRLNISDQVVICDGTTVWTYLQDANEVQVNSVENYPDAITPIRLLTSYHEDYKAKLVGEERKGNLNYYIIELKPHADKSYSRVELTIEKDLLRISKIAIQDKNGNTFSYIVNQFQPEVIFKPGDFTFNSKDYPGVEVIDMR